MRPGDRKQVYIDWVVAGLEKKGKSKSGLAEALDLFGSAVTRIIQGHRDIKAHEVETIAIYLETPAPNSSLNPECPYCLRRKLRKRNGTKAHDGRGARSR